MDISDLTPEEDVALVGLLREIISADAAYSEEERISIEVLRNVLGAERFDAALSRAEGFASRAEVKAHAKTIERPAAREYIYSLLRNIAESDGLAPEEEKPLRWVASWWDLS